MWFVILKIDLLMFWINKLSFVFQENLIKQDLNLIS